MDNNIKYCDRFPSSSISIGRNYLYNSITTIFHNYELLRTTNSFKSFSYLSSYANHFNTFSPILTAYKKLYPIFRNDCEQYISNLKSIIEINKLSKSFFKMYRKKYLEEKNNSLLNEITSINKDLQQCEKPELIIFIKNAPPRFLNFIYKIENPINWDEFIWYDDIPYVVLCCISQPDYNPIKDEDIEAKLQYK